LGLLSNIHILRNSSSCKKLCPVWEKT
jgi:hypothetical protein